MVTITHTAKMVCDFDVSEKGGNHLGYDVESAKTIRSKYGFKDGTKVHCIVLVNVSKLPQAHSVKASMRGGWGSVSLEVKFADIGTWVQKKPFQTVQSNDSTPGQPPLEPAECEQPPTAAKDVCDDDVGKLNDPQDVDQNLSCGRGVFLRVFPTVRL